MRKKDNLGELLKNPNNKLSKELLLGHELSDIPEFNTFIKFEPITKGLSNDKKYRVTANNGRNMLLRLTDIKEFDRKKAEYEKMERVYELGVITPKPYSFGLCNDGKTVYSLSEWLNGEDIESALPRLSETEQYNFGIKAGKLLRKIHTLPAPADAEPWDIRFRNKIQERVDLYNKHNLKSENGEKIIKYLYDKQKILINRPQTFWHGDFSVGNQMLMHDGEIGVIDFNYWIFGHGDPWWEFVIIPWGKEPSAHYLTGMINGYFDNKPPLDFFELLAYYYASDAISAACFAFLGLEPCEPEDGRKHMKNVMRWFDNMKNHVPTWYLTHF